MHEEEQDSVPELRRGIVSARNNYRIASVALQRYDHASEQDLESLTLYGGAFFVFLRAAIDALRFSDSRDDPSLIPVQKDYFEKNIKNSDVFLVVQTERNLIAHGNDSWAIHPFVPLGLIDRLIHENEEEWFDIIQQAVWPFAPFKGHPISEVMRQCLKQVGKWLDDVDALHAAVWSQPPPWDEIDQ